MKSQPGWWIVFAISRCAFGQQSALQPAGEYATRIRELGSLFFWLLGAIFVAVLVVMLTAIARRHRGIDQEPVEGRHHASPETEQTLTRIVGAATIVTVAILFGLVIVSVATGKATSPPALYASGSMVVEVTGNQWWWAIRYPNDDASRIVTTANEIHIPVGRSVMISGTSNDVIHSFWVPELQGKRDLIPSRVTNVWIRADRAGRYRGQCAEFCGMQHAHMALWVVAEPEPEFEAWVESQLKTPGEPTDEVQLRGRQVFLESACALCHEIDGTAAQGQVAPNLTHFGSRLTIGAGTLPNNKGNLAGWIADPQSIKPGNHMATVPVKAADMQPLIEYLESLR